MFPNWGGGEKNGTWSRRRRFTKHNRSGGACRYFLRVETCRHGSRISICRSTDCRQSQFDLVVQGRQFSSRVGKFAHNNRVLSDVYPDDGGFGSNGAAQGRGDRDGVPNKRVLQSDAE